MNVIPKAAKPYLTSSLEPKPGASAAGTRGGAASPEWVVAPDGATGSTRRQPERSKRDGRCFVEGGHEGEMVSNTALCCPGLLTVTPLAWTIQCMDLPYESTPLL